LRCAGEDIGSEFGRGAASVLADRDGREATVGEEVSKSKKKSLFEVVVFVLVVFLLFIIFYSLLRPSNVGQKFPENELRAAILDQLSLYLPNQAFIENTTSVLTNAGFHVDYYPGNEITVDFFRRLPSLGYKLIIMRVHSGLMFKENKMTKNVVFFTSDNYSTSKYILEQLRDEVVPAIVSFTPTFMQDKPVYFAITPDFVKSDMEGRFENTVIIMMGCNGLTYTPMAEALIGRGALVYIGWNLPVSVDYVDNATAHLLNGLIVDGKNILSAVMDTREAVGPDPTYDAELVFYPQTPEVGNFIVRVK
jgi:hypothetical protein